MKFLLYIAVIAAATWSGWFFHPQISKEMAARIETRKADREKREAAIRNEAASAQRTSTGAGALLANLKSQQPGPANPASTTTGAPNTTTPAANPNPANPAPEAAVDPIEARYPMPTFKTIEDITKEWSAIPSRAFARKVKTKVPLTFDVPAGKVELAAGSDARAAAMVGGMLIVMREGDDSSRIQVPLANTDLKETLTALYEKYKEYRRNLVMKQREHARALKARSNGASEEQMKLAGPKPEARA